MSEEMRTGFAGVIDRLREQGQSSVDSLNTLRTSLVGELSGLGVGIANVSNSIFRAALITPPPAPQSAADEEDAQDQRNIFTRMLGTLDAIQRGVTGGRDAVKDEKGFGKLLALFGAGMGGLLTALGPFAKLLKGGLILGAVYFALDAFEEMLNFFEDPSWEGLGNILTSIGISLGLIIAAFPMKTLNLIKKLPRLFRLLRVFFMRTLPNFFKGIMPTITGKLMRVLRFISGAFTALRVFFIGTLLPALSGFLATLTPIIVAAAPFIAIGAAIAFAFFAVYKGIQAFIDKFKETGSIMDGLIAMGTTILTLPFTLIKDLISYIADLLGFENFSSMLDSIDFAASAFEFISGLVNDIVGFFTGLFDIDFGALVRKIPGAGAVLDFLGFGKSGGDLVGEVDRAREEEERTKYAGALGRDKQGRIIRQNQYDRTSGFLGAREQDQGRLMRRSEQQLRAQGLEVISPEERKMIEDRAAERTRQAEQALREFEAMPKLSDMIRDVKIYFNKIYRSIRETVEDFIDNIGNAIFKFFGFGEFDFTIFMMDPKTFLNYHVIMPITDLFNSIGNSVTDFFNDVGQSLIEFFFPDTSMVFSELSPMDFIRNFIIDPLTNFFTNIGLMFFDFFGIDALPLFIGDVSPIEFFKGFILDPIKNFFTNALTTVGEFFQSIMDFDFLQFIKDNVPGAGTALKIIGGIGSAVSSLFGGNGDDPVTEDDRRQALGMTGEERRITAARMQVKDMTDRLTNASMSNNSGDDAKPASTTVNAPVNNISNSSATNVTSTPIVPGNMSLQAMRQASSA